MSQAVPPNAASVKVATESGSAGSSTEHIEKISETARGTWFGLLGTLVFVGVTMMGHKDSDFFAYGAATTLPIANIDVPPGAFFVAAPVLTAVLYAYLHIYLLDLWDALGDFVQPAMAQAQPIADRIPPTMFTVLALTIRQNRRRDGSSSPRVLAYTTVAVTYILGWGLGVIVLGILWWRSMAAHDPLITLMAGAALWAVCLIEMRTRGALYLRMKDISRAETVARLSRQWPVAILLALVIAGVSWERTQSGRFIPLAKADLREAELSQRPDGWLPFSLWLEEFEEQFRKREGLTLGDPFSDRDKDRFYAEARVRWQTFTRSLPKVSLADADLRGADLRGAFLAGADLRWARLDGARLDEAHMPGADLQGARINDVTFWSAQLEGASFREVHSHRPDFTDAQMNLADLSFSDLRIAEFDGAEMYRASVRNSVLLEGSELDNVNAQEADFGGTIMVGARLYGADFTGADLSRTQMSCAIAETVNWRRARLVGARLDHAGMRGANFTGAEALAADFTGAELLEAVLNDVSLQRATLEGANLHRASLVNAQFTFANFTGANVRGAVLPDHRFIDQEFVDGLFGDESTQMPQHLQVPGHWAKARPPDEGPDPEWLDWLADRAPDGNPCAKIIADIEAQNPFGDLSGGSTGGGW